MSEGSNGICGHSKCMYYARSTCIMSYKAHLTSNFGWEVQGARPPWESKGVWRGACPQWCDRASDVRVVQSIVFKLFKHLEVSVDPLDRRVNPVRGGVRIRFE